MLQTSKWEVKIVDTTRIRGCSKTARDLSIARTGIGATHLGISGDGTALVGCSMDAQTYWTVHGGSSTASTTLGIRATLICIMAVRSLQVQSHSLAASKISQPCMRICSAAARLFRVSRSIGHLGLSGAAVMRRRRTGSWTQIRTACSTAHHLLLSQREAHLDFQKVGRLNIRTDEVYENGK